MRTTTFSGRDYLPEALRAFLRRRSAEIGGAAILGGVGCLIAALGTWSVRDPSISHAINAPVANVLGLPGAIAADLIMQLLGISAVATLAPVAFWGWRLMLRRRLDHVLLRTTMLLVGAVAVAVLASLLPATDRWPLPTGLGGVVGDGILSIPRRYFSGLGMALLALVSAVATIVCLTAASGVGLQAETSTAWEDIPGRDEAANDRRSERDHDDEPGLGLVSIGALIHAALSLKGAIRRRLGRGGRTAPAETPRAPWLSARAARTAFDSDVEPVLPARPAGLAGERLEPGFPSLSARQNGLSPSSPTAEQAGKSLVPAKGRGERDGKASPDQPGYRLPPLDFLAEPRRQIANVSDEALEQNARLLEGVLDDFGVKGSIINVRPGPVVTLYELEPAPGIKSSRVIGLADDIARSMCAVSARVAVVQGRNVIGIELPNQRRETVFLRELLGSEEFTGSKHKLAIALGKTIGGEPVIVDLARMPHLLVAGTTGSGKSVAINTMILSLLYRMRPDECRLIMVDPKMLELSVYDGIPHLLTPVVTDPKKAVIALKWAVREMEDRYKKMSKVGVRSIDGFNARIQEAATRGETISRTVHTGYDKVSGEAIYEHEEMDLCVLPYIVVVIDEMADLMMVAGRDIEGAVQRLAQMARAAGIHLITATQRPSVDVITGTIKANFPTRISFQVTSKIDSRTILGEQGAEQLLGQGDMLHMAGGGRISRVHGPFVSDAEVEKVVAHLKSQAKPRYLTAVLQGDGEADDEHVGEGDRMAGGEHQANDGRASPLHVGDETGDLYDRAVALVLRDRKCSTSYVQRRLQVGYNKAASLVERMEKAGVVGAPNHAGKRVILVADDEGAHGFDAAED